MHCRRIPLLFSNPHEEKKKNAAATHTSIPPARNMANDSAGKTTTQKENDFSENTPLIFFSDRIWGKRGAGAESSIFIHVTGEPHMKLKGNKEGVSENVKPKERKGSSKCIKVFLFPLFHFCETLRKKYAKFEILPFFLVFLGFFPLFSFISKTRATRRFPSQTL